MGSCFCASCIKDIACTPIIPMPGQQSSRTPWLTAIGLWPQGTTYGGGGRFTDNRSAILRADGNAHPNHPGSGFTSPPATQPTMSHPAKLKALNGRDAIKMDGWCSLLNGLLMHRPAAGDDICLADFKWLRLIHGLRRHPPAGRLKAARRISRRPEENAAALAKASDPPTARGCPASAPCRPWSAADRSRLRSASAS